MTRQKTDNRDAAKRAPTSINDDLQERRVNAGAVALRQRRSWGEKNSVRLARSVLAAADAVTAEFEEAQ